ncbi:MAG TPA: wax ester/triacylglycerol synthase family O-acyltransferase [Acidimicrobiales bacterium]
MQRLSGLDDTFLWMETPSSYMHVASLIVVDGASVAGGLTHDRVRALYESRLDQAPPFRRRLVQVPFGLHHPLWIEDPDFNLDWHLRTITMPADRNSLHDLADLAAKLNAIHLDRTRPLWEMWTIDGIENGLVGLLTKVHHAAIDGASGEELMVAILDLEPDPEPQPDPEVPWAPDPIPSDTELLAYATWSLAQQPVKAVGAIKRTVESALRVREQNRQPNITPPPAPFSAPATSFNGPITPERSFAASSLPLAEVKAVKNAFGCTVNDVVLTMCAGALRSYLDAHGETPDAPLVAMVPMSVRSEDQKGTHGNQVTSMLTSLATDLDDPVDRLRHIHDNMARAKEQTNAIGADTLQDWAEFAAPAIFGRAARLYSNTKMAGHRPLFNVTISNVPGPPFPLYVAGARMVDVFPMGPIYDGGALNITLMSYLDRLDFGLVACPDLLEDVWMIADGLGAALTELREAAAELVRAEADALAEAAKRSKATKATKKAKKATAPAS